MIFVYIILNLVLSVGSDNGNQGELHFVAVLYRHGDRAPLRSYPNDPHHSENIWPNGWGQLTNLGKLQQFELGKWLRNKYHKFLPSKYSPQDIYVIASDYDRTLLSAHSTLAGLYECWMKESKTKGFEWTAIPVHTVPIHLDPVLAWKKPCPLYDVLYRSVASSEEVEIINEFYKEFFNTIQEGSGLEIETVADVLPIYDVLHVQNLHGMQLPSWTKNVYPEPITEITEYVFRLATETVEMKRLRCGPLVKEILNRMEQKVEGLLTQKMWMYSAHESTIAHLMQCLNIYDGILPAYSSMLIFELYKKQNEWWMMISYKTQTTVHVLRIPDCDRLCPLNTFKSLVQPVVPENWDQECNNVTAAN